MRIDAIVEKIAARARIERVGHMRYVGEFFGVGHRHEGLHHLDVLEQGRTRVCVDGASYVLDAGQALFVRAGRRHSSDRRPRRCSRLQRIVRLNCQPETPVMPVVCDETLGVPAYDPRIFRCWPGRDAALRLYLAELFYGFAVPCRTWRRWVGVGQRRKWMPAMKNEAGGGLHPCQLRAKISAHDIAATIHVSVSFMAIVSA